MAANGSEKQPELGEIQESSSGDEGTGEWCNGEGVTYAGSAFSDLGNDGDDDITDEEDKLDGVKDENKDDKEEEIDDVERLILNNIRQQNRRKSTLPNLMNKYGLHNESQKQPTERLKRKKKSKSFNLDDDKEQEKKKQRETEKYLQIYEDLHKIRDYYKSEYLGALKRKVKKQHNKIKELDEARELKHLEQKEQERQASHRVKRRLRRHEFIHDDSFLKNIPKTELFKIVHLQDRLQKEGRLKNNTDIDDFWKGIQDNPDLLNLYLNKLNMEGKSEDIPSSHSQAGEGHEESQQSLASRPGTVEGKESWAITQMYQHQNTSSRRRQSVNTLAKQAAVDLDKHCPMMEMPDLYCFRLDLGERPPDPIEMIKNVDVRAKEHQRKKLMRKLHKMHQLALTHSVATNRILYRHADDMEMVFGGPDVQDVIDVDYCIRAPREMTSPEREFTLDPRLLEYSDPVREDETRFPPISAPGVEGTRRGSVSSQEVRSKTADSMSSSAKTRGSRGSTKKDLMRVAKSAGGLDQIPAIQGPMDPLPLTMEEVTGQAKIVEAKCASLYWNNYLKAGKKLPMVTQVG